MTTPFRSSASAVELQRDACGSVSFGGIVKALSVHDQLVLRWFRDGIRAIGERGNALLKMTFRALRNVSLDPWRIGKVVAAALVILHFDHARSGKTSLP